MELVLPPCKDLQEEDAYDFIDTLLLQMGLNFLFRYVFLVILWLIFLIVTFYSLSRIDAYDQRLQAEEQKRKQMVETKAIEAWKEKEIIEKRNKEKALSRQTTYSELRQREETQMVVEDV